MLEKCSHEMCIGLLRYQFRLETGWMQTGRIRRGRTTIPPPNYTKKYASSSPTPNSCQQTITPVSSGSRPREMRIFHRLIIRVSPEFTEFPTRDDTNQEQRSDSETQHHFQHGHPQPVSLAGDFRCKASPDVRRLAVMKITVVALWISFVDRCNE